MPTISEFFGILIRMYWDDHPPPHFHALYGEHEAHNIAALMRWWSSGRRCTKMS